MIVLRGEVFTFPRFFINKFAGMLVITRIRRIKLGMKSLLWKASISLKSLQKLLPTAIL